MVDVFRAVRRVLRDDGTLWLNIGDSYATSGGNDSRGSSDGGVGRGDRPNERNRCGLKPKDLVGIPWLLAFALRADGWWLRQDIIWHKPNPMPESCTDRCTKAHEYVFLLTKKPRYFYDADAVREDGPTYTRLAGGYAGRDGNNASRFGGKGGFGDSDVTTVGRNRRSVWTIPTQPYSKAHFATYPEKLVEPCVMAGTSQKGCCPECGAPWTRVVKKTRYATRPGDETKMALARGAAMFKDSDGKERYDANSDIVGNRDQYRHMTETRTVGWQSGCVCVRGLVATPAIPCTVLDPFAGAGTTGVTCKRLGRSFIGIELSGEYAAMASKRIADPDAKAPVPDVVGQATMFGADPVAD